MIRHKVLYTRVSNERYQELQVLAAALNLPMSTLIADSLNAALATIREAAAKAKEERAAA